MEQQAATAPGRQAPYAGYAPQPYGGASTSSGTAVKGERSDMQEALMGIGLGLVIGVVGAVIIEKVLFYAHFSFSLLFVGLGYGIGWGIHRVTGDGGTGLALAAVGVMAAALFVGQVVLRAGHPEHGTERADASATLFDALPVSVTHLGPLYWVCMGFGLLTCYRGVEQQQ